MLKNCYKKLISLLLVNLLISCESKDPLSSWQEGLTKKQLVEFVQNTTNFNHPNYIPPKDRIATFDQDGTLWVEHPIYTQAVFAIDRIKELAPFHPEWKDKEPYKSIIENNLESISQFSLADIEKIVAATHANISTDDFRNLVINWLDKAKHPKFNRPYTDLTYLPMQELIDYLKKNGFTVYIVSGGGQDFIRAYSEKVYGIAPEFVIGTTSKTQYKYENEKPYLKKTSDILLVDDKKGKPEAIHLFIGKRPIAAFGNSDGDKEMLEWSKTANKATLQMLILHDDALREYAYDKETKIGPFSDALKEKARQNHWIIVSMKNDWKKIFK